MTRRRIIGHCAVLAALFAAGAMTSSQAQTQRPEMIGYFPSWKWNVPEGNAARIPYDRITIINYAFFVPLPDGSIAGKDTAGDARYLSVDASQSLVARAHRHGVKVVLSLGGWSDSENFPLVASTPALRSVFSGACANAVRKYAFDGIDIDWEFPGYRDHKGTPDDRRNFTLLLSSLRDTLGALGQRNGRPYLLTAALPSGGEHVRNLEVERIAPLLDICNLMTYDFYGPWDPLANHNSPLYASVGADTSRSVDASVRLYRDAYRVPASKITIGVASYGHAFANCAALNTAHGGADTAHFPQDVTYAAILRILKTSTRVWDEQARVPYLVDPARHMLVSYDDEVSVREKGQYTLKNHLRGAIVWEITDDATPDGRNPLLESLSAALFTHVPPDH